VDAYLGERRAYPERAEGGVLLDPPHGRVGLEVGLPDAAPGVRPVVEALRPLLDPPP
jgi:hypothetical protein